MAKPLFISKPNNSVSKYLINTQPIQFYPPGDSIHYLRIAKNFHALIEAMLCCVCCDAKMQSKNFSDHKNKIVCTILYQPLVIQLKLLNML